jgi:hypothetical protein
LVPVVSDLTSGIPEVVTPANGALVPVEDITGYARAILRLHENREELAGKSATAYAWVKTGFSAAAMADRWLGAFPAPPIFRPPWPGNWRISGPLAAKSRFRFWPPIRMVRRLAARL